MEFVQLNLTFENRDWLVPVSDFFLGQEALSVEVSEARPTLTVLLRPGADTDSMIARFSTYREIVGIPDPTFERGLLPDTDWISVFKEHFKAFRMNRYVQIIPDWEATDRDRNDPGAVVVEPGQAFGTGLHPTTSLAAEYVAEFCNDHPECSMLDAGTGSGILSLVALKRGAADVCGFDIDPLCSDAIHHHLALNGRTGFDMRAFIGGHEALRTGGRADLVVVNIIETIIRRMLPALKDWTGNRLVLSGILERDALDFEQFLSLQGITVLDSRTRSEWIAYLCEC